MSDEKPSIAGSLVKAGMATLGFAAGVLILLAIISSCLWIIKMTNWGL